MLHKRAINFNYEKKTLDIVCNICYILFTRSLNMKKMFPKDLDKMTLDELKMCSDLKSEYYDFCYLVAYVIRCEQLGVCSEL